MTTIHLHQRQQVTRLVRVQRSHNAKIINRCGDLGENLADFDSAFSILAELERGGHQAPRSSVGLDLRTRQWLAVVLGQGWLRIERIHLRDPTVEEQENDALRFRREMRSLGGERPSRGFGHQRMGHSQRAETTPHHLQCFSSSHEKVTPLQFTELNSAEASKTCAYFGHSSPPCPKNTTPIAISSSDGNR